MPPPVQHDLLLIQSPHGNLKIDMLIDEVRIVLGSTVFLTAQANGYLVVNDLEGGRK